MAPARSRTRSGSGDNRRPGGPRQTGRPQDLVRRTAFDVLRAVDTRDAYANLLLPNRLRERGLTGRDAALATELTYGTLRGRGTYDAILAMCSDRPPHRIIGAPAPHPAIRHLCGQGRLPPPQPAF